MFVSNGPLAISSAAPLLILATNADFECGRLGPGLSAYFNICNCHKAHMLLVHGVCLTACCAVPCVHPAGLAEPDRQLVERLFVEQKIQVGIQGSVGYRALGASS